MEHVCVAACLSSKSESKLLKTSNKMGGQVLMGIEILLSQLSKGMCVQDHELGPMLLSAVSLACLTATAFVITPVREGLVNDIGPQYLHALIWISTVLIIILNPLLGLLFKNRSVQEGMRVFIRGCEVCLIAFIVTFSITPATTSSYWSLCVLFYLWSVIVVPQIVSLFWCMASDIWTAEQALRLFCKFMIGGSAGQLLGSALVAICLQWVQQHFLLLIGVVLLRCSTLCIGKAQTLLVQPLQGTTPKTDPEQPPMPASPTTPAQLSTCLERGSDSKENFLQETPPQKEHHGGLHLVVASPFLRNIFLFTFYSACFKASIYMKRVDALHKAGVSTQTATTFAASINASSAVVTLLLQLFASGGIAKTLGVTGMLLALPLLTIGTELCLWAMPVPLVYGAVDALRKVGQYTVSKPMTQALYVTVSPTERVLAKGLIDSVGPKLGSSLSAGMVSATVGLHTWFHVCSLAAGLLWSLVGWQLSVEHGSRMAKTS